MLDTYVEAAVRPEEVSIQEEAHVATQRAVIREKVGSNAAIITVQGGEGFTGRCRIYDHNAQASGELAKRAGNVDGYPGHSAPDPASAGARFRPGRPENDEWLRSSH